mmetsp:Transcript_83153/g.165030  ORF Transcript_83153/g.165030 Transcript_83153/m.165030 type:complete len:206 (-) Transcript_83153:186-803(-)|eukprot:CAMPEP_0172726302 /NCGR_PEP_ID=MMETSP1074-20121228/90432_1 /TAXON_ID=2916 /ORGANISM="Ceratium fusus, Strain PA161109" /LENGTH=205 /DNA_ID=CAMNT_0013553283 /DNA_START=51 /DNA_END=668 /DNA_ORIENTATION=+
MTEEKASPSVAGFVVTRVFDGQEHEVLPLGKVDQPVSDVQLRREIKNVFGWPADEILLCDGDGNYYLSSYISGASNRSRLEVDRELPIVGTYVSVDVASGCTERLRTPASGIDGVEEQLTLNPDRSAIRRRALYFPGEDEEGNYRREEGAISGTGTWCLSGFVLSIAWDTHHDERMECYRLGASMFKHPHRPRRYKRRDHVQCDA